MMKYSIDITINRPINEVVNKFGNPEDSKKWLKGLISFEPSDDGYGKPGTKTLLVFKSGKKKMKIVETIISNDLPRDFKASYKTKNVFNIVHNIFEELKPNETRFISHQELYFSGVMKFFGIFMTNAFKKQSVQYLHDFKNYVEK